MGSGYTSLNRGYSLYTFRQFEVKVDTFVGGQKLEMTETRQQLVPVLEEASFYMDEDGKIYVLRGKTTSGMTSSVSSTSLRRPLSLTRILISTLRTLGVPISLL